VHGIDVHPLLVALALVAVSVIGCGDTGHGDDPRRPVTPDERVLADRYRVVVGLLREADAAAVCGMSTGEAARDLRCASSRPLIPRKLRSPRPRHADLFIYPDLDGLIFGAPLRGRDARLFVGLERGGQAASWPIYTIGLGQSG
jgi:hypothetical protein